jgi:hypothetical protein
LKRIGAGGKPLQKFVEFSTGLQREKVFNLFPFHLCVKPVENVENLITEVR